MLFSIWWCNLFYIFCYFAPKTESVKLFPVHGRGSPTVFTRFVPKVRSKTCFLKPESGPCRGKIRMYYYNPVTQNCSRFDWGGCQGNGNRFDSEEQCFDSCLSKPGTKPIPRFCRLTFDYGFCFGAVQRWYYDRNWKVCKSTIYSGCGGNKNNFYNLENCELVCRFGKQPKGTGQRTTRTGEAKTVLVINPFDETTKKLILRSEGTPSGGTDKNGITTAVTVYTNGNENKDTGEKKEAFRSRGKY